MPLDVDITDEIYGKSTEQKNMPQVGGLDVDINNEIYGTPTKTGILDTVGGYLSKAGQTIFDTLTPTIDTVKEYLTPSPAPIVSGVSPEVERIQSLKGQETRNIFRPLPLPEAKPAREPLISAIHPLQQFQERPLTPTEEQQIRLSREMGYLKPTAETLGEAFIGGIIPANVRPEVKAKYPITSFVGNIVGLIGAGKATEPITQIGKLLTQYPALKMIAEGVAHGGATFGVKDLSDQIMEQTGMDSKTSIDTSRLLLNTAIGMGFGATATIPSAIKTSVWFRKATIPERGLIIQTVDDLRSKGYSDLKISQLKPEFYQQELAKRTAPDITTSEAFARDMEMKKGQGITPEPILPESPLGVIQEMEQTIPTKQVVTPEPVGAIKPAITAKMPTVDEIVSGIGKQGVIEPTTAEQLQGKARLEPIDQINEITGNELKTMIKEGDPKAVTHIKEAVDKHGVPAMQDLTRRLETEVIAETPKADRSQIIETIKGIKPDINEALKSEVKSSENDMVKQYIANRDLSSQTHNLDAIEASLNKNKELQYLLADYTPEKGIKAVEIIDSTIKENRLPKIKVEEGEYTAFDRNTQERIAIAKRISKLSEKPYGKELLPEIERLEAKYRELWGDEGLTADEVKQLVIKDVAKQPVETPAEITHEGETITPQETKEVLKDAGDEKIQTTFKEQKSYLISEIDNVIKDASGIKPTFYIAKNKSGTRWAIYRSENESIDSTYSSKADAEDALHEKLTGRKWGNKPRETQYPEGTEKVTIEVPGDGTFEIYNTKSALTKFKDIIQKNFPEKEEYRTKTPYQKESGKTIEQRLATQHKDFKEEQAKQDKIDEEMKAKQGGLPEEKLTRVQQIDSEIATLQKSRRNKLGIFVGNQKAIDKQIDVLKDEKADILAPSDTLDSLINRYKMWGKKPSPTEEVVGKGEGSALKEHSDFAKYIADFANKEGKPVPPEVLKDYPDLAKEAKVGEDIKIAPIVSEMFKAGRQSLSELRSQISNVRYGKEGEILFEFKGKTYSTPEPKDVIPVGQGEASQSWALKQILDKQAKESPVVKPELQGEAIGTKAGVEAKPTVPSDIQAIINKVDTGKKLTGDEALKYADYKESLKVKTVTPEIKEGVTVPVVEPVKPIETKPVKSIESLVKEGKPVTVADLKNTTEFKQGSATLNHIAEILKGKGIEVTGKVPLTALEKKQGRQTFRITEDTKVTNIKGKEITLPKNEEYTAYPLGEGKIRLQDGKQVTVYEGELKNIKGELLGGGDIKAGGIFHEKKTKDPAKKILGGDSGFINTKVITEGIKKVNPFEATNAELLGLKINEVKGVFTGKKSKAVKLWSIPYWVGEKWPKFKEVYNNVTDPILETNEVIDDFTTDLYTKDVKNKLSQNPKVAEILYSAQEESAPHWYIKKSALKNLNITDEELKNFDAIRKEIPLVEGPLQTRPETLLEHGYTENQVLDYLKVRKIAMNWNESKQNLLDIGFTSDEIYSRKGTGKVYSNEELQQKGLNDRDIELYKTAREIFDFITPYQIEKKKWQYGYYDEKTTPIQKAMLDMQINQAVKRYGGYVPLMRFGDHWISYTEPATGEIRVSAFESQKEQIKAKNDLNAEGITVKTIDMADVRKMRQHYPHLSLSQLDSLIEAADIKGEKTIVEELRNVIKERMGDARLIKREWTPGYFRTGENIVKTIEEYSDQTLRQYSKAKAKVQAQKLIDNMDNLKLKQYAQDYLDAYLGYHKDVFEVARNFGYLYYLGGKMSFGLQNLTQPFLTTLPRLYKDVGGIKGSYIWSKGYIDAGRYIAHRIAELAGKDIKVGLDQNLIKYLDKLRSQRLISGNFTEEVLAIKRGVKYLEGAERNRSMLSNVLGVIGSSTEKLNRIHAAISAWEVGKSENISEAEIYRLAQDYIRSTQYDYGSHNTPVQIAKFDKELKGVAKSAFLFKSWGLNYIHGLNKYLRGSVSGKEKIRNTKGIVSSLVTLGTLSGIRGIPLIMTVAAIYTLITGDSPDEKFREALGEDNGKLADALLYGPVSQQTGTNLSGIIGVGDYLGSKPALMGIVDRYKRGIQEYEKDNYWEMAKQMSPPAISNYLTGKEWEEEGVAKTSYGERLTEVTPSEIKAKKMSLTPLKVTKEYEKRYQENLLKSKVNKLSQEYTDKMAKALIAGDVDKENDIRRKVFEHNTTHPSYEQIILNPKTIDNKIGKILEGRDIKTFPKRIRDEISRRSRYYEEESEEQIGGLDVDITNEIYGNQ